MEVAALTHARPEGPHRLLRLRSDERLIALTRRGSEAAFEVLAARYRARLLAFCQRSLRSREDAEDVVQEVLAAAFGAILADDRPINAKPWLYRIARNRSLDHLRRVKTVRADSFGVDYGEHPVSTADAAAVREELRALVKHIQDLPEAQRKALLLRELGGLSYAQIGEVMERTTPGVKSLLWRARVSLAGSAGARA